MKHMADDLTYLVTFLASSIPTLDVLSKLVGSSQIDSPDLKLHRSLVIESDGLRQERS